MDERPRRLIIRILEFAALFALSAFLLRLGVAYLREIWWVLLIITVIAALAVFAYRIYKNKVQW